MTSPDSQIAPRGRLSGIDDLDAVRRLPQLQVPGGDAASVARGCVPVRLRSNLNQHFVRIVLFVHEAIVAVLREGAGDAEGRLVHPHEVVIADHERQAAMALTKMR